MTQSRGTTER